MIIITSTHGLDSIEKTISTLIQERMWKIRLRTNYEAMRMNALFKFNMEFRGQMRLLFCLTKSFVVVHEFLTCKTRALTSHLKTIYNQKPIMGFWYNRINVSELFFLFFFLMLLYFLCLRHLLFYHECVEAKPLLNSFQKTWFSLLHLFGEISWNYEETGRKFIYSLSSQINFLTPNNSLAIPISKPYIVSFINYENLKLHVHQNDTPWLISVLFWSPIFGKNFCRMTRNIRGSLFLGMDDFFCVLRNFFLQLGQSAWVSKSWPSF